MALIPVTILTGFLGAGKTTLLKHILQEQHGHKIAVIENEFGEESIDNELLMQDQNEQIVEMNNGCICCTVRGDLIVALGKLASQRREGQIEFERVIIETTGLANPGPVAQTFFLDDEVATSYRLDAVITVVDAKHGRMQLERQEEAQRQVGFADKLLLSKTDLVSEQEKQVLMQRLVAINPRAPITTVDFGKAPLDHILDIRGFNLNDKLEIDPGFLQEAHHHHHDCDEHCEHDHAHAPEHGHAHGNHTPGISAFVFRSDRPFEVSKLDEFLGGLIQVYGTRMLRYKGVLWMDGADRKVVFQGVHQTMGSDIGSPWDEGEVRGSKIIFIGQDLPQATFIRGLEQCLV